MTEIRFYHLERLPLEKVLPGLISKIHENGHRVLIKTADEKTAEEINTLLWTFQKESFLPHGTRKDGHAEHQPVWITERDENPNGADVLVLTQGAKSENIRNFKICCYVFDGINKALLETARADWKNFQSNNYDLTYWQQTEKGWEKRDF